MAGFHPPVFFHPEKDGKHGARGNQSPDGRETQGGDFPESDLGEEIIRPPENGSQGQVEVGKGKSFSLRQRDSRRNDV